MSERNLEPGETLPSVADAFPDYGSASVLSLTIVFHPQLSRIGESARLTAQAMSGKRALVLGRNSLNFARAGLDASPALPLQDHYISRRALEFEECSIGGATSVKLRRAQGASRCRVDGQELQSDVELSAQQLQVGVAIYLAHTVVLMLRYQPPCVTFESEPVALRGSSSYINILRRQVVQAAACDLDVLVRGETGTGKELVAEAVHTMSARATAPLITVNMAAIPESLAAASLFGAARGAYTGADRATQGYFQQAQGGSLFLDEIGEASLELQPQLLRAIQQREVQRVGGPVQSVDVRIISATDAQLDGTQCDFKSALRHRLGAIEIVLQPLREHPEDIGELLLHFLRQSLASLSRKVLLPNENSEPIEIAACAGIFYQLTRYKWPGNVRQLANFAAQIALDSEEQLTLPRSIQRDLEGADPLIESPRALVGAGTAAATVRGSIHAVDEQTFDAAMRSHNHEVRSVAEALGVSHQAVYRRIREMPQYRLAADISDEELRRAMRASDGCPNGAALMLCVSSNSLKVRLRSLPALG